MPFQRLSNDAIRFVNGKALLLSSTSVAPVVTVTAITLTPATGTANSASGTIIGTLAATVTNGPLNSPAWALTGTAGGDFQIVNGNQVAVLPSNVPAGNYTITAQVSASNLATPFSQAVTVTMNSSGNPGTAPAKLSDITWTQPYPVHPNASDASTVGYFDPVNGIGPFKITFTVTNANGGNDSGNYAFRDEGHFVVSVIYGNPPGTVPQTITATCTDGRGDTVTRSFPIARSDATPRISINARNPVPNDFTNPFYNDFFLRCDAAGSGHSSGDTFTFTGQNGAALPTIFQPDGSKMRYTQAPPPAGDYLFTVTSNGLTLNYTRTFVNYTPLTYVEAVFTSIVSTSVVPGAVVGYVAATTPNNAPVFSCTDSSNTFSVNAIGQIVIANTPSTAGPLSFNATVVDGQASHTITVTASIVQGQTLDPSAMTATLNTALDNGINSIGQTVVTPSVTGVTGTKNWSLVQENFNTQALSNGSLGYLFSINASTGVITVANLLMAKTHKLILSCTDGINTCTKTLNLVVAWAPTTRTIHVGRGMASAYGADGFEHIVDARHQLNTGARATTTQMLVYADADDNYYADDTGTLVADYNARFAWNGPLIVTGVAANGKQQPRTGGNTAKWSQTGRDMYGKGFWTMGNGDCILDNLEISHCFGGSQSDGVEGTRKDGETYGNYTVRNCYIHDCDNGIETGFGGSDIICQNNEIVHCGTSHVSNGACHNFYIGQQWSATVTGNYSAMAMTGHLFKCRAFRGLIDSNRFYDLEMGSSSQCIDICNGGDYTITNNKVQKGALAQNPYAIDYALDPTAPDYRRNTCTIQNNVISIMTMAGGHIGAPVVLHNFANGGAADYYSNPFIVNMVNNQVYFSPQSLGTLLSHDGPSSLDQYTTATGTTTLTAPVALDFTRPYLTGSMPRQGWWREVTQYGNDNLSQFDGNEIDLGVDDLVIPHTTATGTVLSTLAAHCQMDDYNGTPTNPFVAGTTWALSTDGVYYPDQLPNPWDTTHFGLATNSDGTAKLTLTAAISAGVYYIQPKATAPNGSVSKWRFYVVVT